MSKKTGRPKEEGGHKRHQVSFGKFVSEALKKVGNKSQFLERIAKPVLEQLDPGPLCHLIQSFDQQITLETEQALRNKDYGKVQALSNFASWLQDYRGLCELPQLDLPLEPKQPKIKKSVKPKVKFYPVIIHTEETHQPTAEDRRLLRRIEKMLSNH